MHSDQGQLLEIRRYLPGLQPLQGGTEDTSHGELHCPEADTILMEYHLTNFDMTGILDAMHRCDRAHKEWRANPGISIPFHSMPE
jgi:hypothetical protein